MKKFNKTSIAPKVFLFALFCLAAVGILIVAKARTPDATGTVAAVSENKTGGKISADLRERIGVSPTGERVSAIVQFNGGNDAAVDRLLNDYEASLESNFKNLGTRAVEISIDKLESFAARNEVRYVSLNRDAEWLGHIDTTTGTAAMRSRTGNNNLDGTGIGIAVIDSSVFNSHAAFLGADGNKRVVLNEDFTKLGASSDDYYGHGTHVAALAAGNNRHYNGASASDYAGVARNANIINLRALDKYGKGKTSWVLGAIDWVMANRARYNIRVVNLSLGAPAVDSYRNDPLCQAVRRLVDASVVTVVAAGNDGKDASGNKKYGQIHAPGNEPSAITVGASNTFGTDARNDDGITTYSSRGPTRSYETDAQGVKHYDNLIKPDLVAPGNKLIAAESKRNTLTKEYSQLNAYTDGNDDHELMFLSGTSMAAPQVAGTAALLLQANPRLTPNMVKAILMYTAQPLSG